MLYLDVHDILENFNTCIDFSICCYSNFISFSFKPVGYKTPISLGFVAYVLILSLLRYKDWCSFHM